VTEKRREAFKQLEEARRKLQQARTGGQPRFGPPAPSSPPGAFGSPIPSPTPR
jgi:hypothetical protein